MQRLRIDPEFQALLAPLAAGELALLEGNIASEGCRDALVAWSGTEPSTLLDGHNRKAICERLGLAYRVTLLDLPDRAAAFNWIIDNQLGRRSITPEHASYLRGKRYNREKKQGERNDLTSPHCEEKSQASHRLAEEYKVGHATIERDGQFAAAVDRIAELSGREAREAILEREAKIDRKTTVAIAKLADEDPERAKRVVEEALTGARVNVPAETRAARREDGAKASDCPVGDKWNLLNADVLVGLGKIAAGSVRLAFADPPYNIGVDYGSGGKADSLPDPVFLDWCGQWMAAVHSRLTPDGSFWVMINDEYAAEFGCALKAAGFTVRNWIKWYETFGVNCAGKFNRTSRHIFYCLKDEAAFVFNREAVSRPSDRQTKYADPRANPDGKILDDVWTDIPRLAGTHMERLAGFPTQLPVELLKRIVACASNPGDLVLDIFSGSGTTGAAAIALRRRYAGIEKNPEYVRLSNIRLKGVQLEIF